MSPVRRARAAHAGPGGPAPSSPRPRHGRLLPAPLTALVLGTAGGGLALLAVLAPAPAPEAAAPLALAQAALAPAPVAPDLDERAERASRTRRAAAPATPAVPPPPVLPGCDGQPHALDAFANGRLPDRVLCEVPGSGERLRADAAVAFVRMARAYEQALGEPVCLTDGYRPLAEQQQLRRTKPRYAARPGHSEHGWGLAVDLTCGAHSFRSAEHAWLVANAPAFGWHLPEWAQRGGSRPEPWHWEFQGAAG